MNRPVEFERIEDFYKLVEIEDQLPLEMWEMLDKGLTVGIFQIEDGKMAKWLARQIKPRNLEELALLTALNRPGPLKSGAAERYMAGRNGNPHDSVHPILDKVCSESYGEIVYQEQFINFFRELGYDAKEADNIRAIVGKKKRDKMAQIKPDYMNRFALHPETKKMTIIVDKDGILFVKDLAEQIWESLENFADYAFNKAHSIEYGLISLWTLYAKWYDAPAFILGMMRSLVREGKKDQIPRYVREAQRMGIPVLAPDLNLSTAETSIVDGAIRYGFADVKGVGMAPAKWLVANRPYQDFDDVEAKATEDERKITLKNGMRKKGINSGQIGKLRMLHELVEEELIEAEEELLGVALSDKTAEILAEYASEIEQDCTPLEGTYEEGSYMIAGVITNIKNAKTRQGTPMGWVTIDNDGEERELAVWNTELQRLSFCWRRRQAVIAHIRVTSRGASIVNAKPLYSKKSKVAYSAV